DLEAVARVHLEELEVLEHPPVGGEARDVNVEGGLGRGRRADRGFALGAEQPYRLPLDLFSLDGGRRGRVPAGPHAVGARGRAMQAVEHLLVGGRILRDPRDCRAKRVHGARRGASVSVRYAPTNREPRVSCRTESETMMTVASNARTAFTPRSSKPSFGWTTRSSARTVAAAPHRSSPAWEMIPSDSPRNSRPSDD